MKRFKWGPDLGEILLLAVLSAPADAAPAPVLEDVELVFKSVDPSTGQIFLEMPPYDPAKQLQPDRVYAVLYPAGDAIHNDPEAAIGAGYPVTSESLPIQPAGLEITLERPALAKPGVKYTGKTVVQFGLDDPPQTPETAPTA